MQMHLDGTPLQGRYLFLRCVAVWVGTSPRRDAD